MIVIVIVKVNYILVMSLSIVFFWQMSPDGYLDGHEVGTVPAKSQKADKVGKTRCELGMN